MAKLFFYYSAMNAGKSTVLLQSHHNYLERGMQTLLYTAALDHRCGYGIINSRIGLKQEALTYDGDFNFFEDVSKRKTQMDSLSCVLIDEAQFLSKKHVLELCQIPDKLGVPVLAYGLRTDFRGELFEGSKYLLARADKIKELKAICFCGRKATMVIRVDGQGNAITQGSQVEIGGNDLYVSMCRRHFKENYYRQTMVPLHQLPLEVVDENK